MIIIKINDCKKNIRIRSAACGVLLAIGVPNAAVTAGWELSAAFGAMIGELTAVLIFVLGVSVSINIHELSNKRAISFFQIFSAAVYTLVSGGRCYLIMSAEKASIYLLFTEVVKYMLVVISMIYFFLNEKRSVIAALLCLLSLWTVIAITGTAADKSSMLIPVSSAFITGTSINYIIDEDDIDWRWMLGSMTSIILLGAVY